VEAKLGADETGAGGELEVGTGATMGDGRRGGTCACEVAAKLMPSDKIIQNRLRAIIGLMMQSFAQSAVQA